MKIEIKEKEAKAIMNAIKTGASCLGEKVPSTWDMLRNIYSGNDNLMSIKPDFKTGNVTIEINEDYISKGIDIYSNYLSLIIANVMTTIQLCENMYADVETLAKEFTTNA